MKTAILQVLLTSFVALSGEYHRGFRCASLAHRLTNCARLAQDGFKKLPGLADGLGVGNDEAVLALFHREIRLPPFRLARPHAPH